MVLSRSHHLAVTSTFDIFVCGRLTGAVVGGHLLAMRRHYGPRSCEICQLSLQAFVCRLPLGKVYGFDGAEARCTYMPATQNIWGNGSGWHDMHACPAGTAAFPCPAGLNASYSHPEPTCLPFCPGSSCSSLSLASHVSLPPLFVPLCHPRCPLCLLVSNSTLVLCFHVVSFQLVVEDLCELWSLFQQKLEIRIQQRFTGDGFSSGEVGVVGCAAVRVL